MPVENLPSGGTVITGAHDTRRAGLMIARRWIAGGYAAPRVLDGWRVRYGLPAHCRAARILAAMDAELAVL